ncbi:MAG: hypothetical protein CFE43_20960 [Burkholderiales bacterium PBB3]|nr:MAG: hypothetical protein CFE43_20960 [Burkholderiales bacterium PBB3]
MFSDPLLTVVNVVLIVGIALALFAAFKIGKGTQKLRAENRANKRKDKYSRPHLAPQTRDI